MDWKQPAPQAMGLNHAPVRRAGTTGLYSRVDYLPIEKNVERRTLMKILYVGTEPAEAQAVATAAGSLGEHVSVSWADGFDRVANWVDENDGLRVLVVEAQPDAPVWRPVLAYAAGLPIALPVVVIVPEAPFDLQPLDVHALECVTRSSSLPRELPVAIARAIDRAQQSQPERAMWAGLDQKLAQATAAIHEAERRHQSAMAAAAEQLARSQSQYEVGMARAAAVRDMVNEQFREAALEVERVRLRHASAVADAERLARREAELSVELDSATRTRGDLERRIADAETALQAGDARAAEERRVAAELASERQRELELRIAEEIDKRRGVEDTLSYSVIARTATEERHASALIAAAVQSRELQDALNAARQDLEEQERSAHAALAEAQGEHQAAAADIARLSEREAFLTSELAQRQALFARERAQAEEERASLAAQLREAEEACDHARREHQSVVVAIAQLRERETELERRLEEEHATCNTLEQAVADTAAALLEEQQRNEFALTSAACELAERQAHFAREHAQGEAERDRLIARLRELEEARNQAQRDHQAVIADVTRLTEHAAVEREAAAACQRDLERRLGEAEDANGMLDRERLALEQSMQASREELHRLDQELRAERERLEHAHTDARIASQEVLDRLSRDYAEVLTTRENDIEQLRNSLHESRSENHRLFQQAPLPMFRCTKDGVLTQANRLLTTLVGHRSAGELIGADLAAAAFESPNDLSWLIERCLGSKGRESAETTWRRKDGSRLLVRLSASAISPELIECGVEDLTPIRVLNDRLSQAHRMEAVGRLATEVAVTCGSLLDSVHQNAQQWLTAEGNDPAFQHHGERLLEEISRAAGFLRQLVAYGDEESRTPAVVELRTVVRDVAPVLKRVAGDSVDVQLPSPSAPLNVDAGAERVKRLFVNLAAYGRDRMPSGGRLKIEIGKTVVDRHFAAKHPNVRLGPHALVTVTESRRSSRADGLLQRHDNEGGSGSRTVAPQTGVDLGTLQELVAECGGHLWMTVEPAGDMEVKIRLPLVTSYGEPPQRSLALGGRPRTFGSWFQH